MEKRIYDCFIFFNELELLELRLRELQSCVDFFVICEAPVTFRGKQKPLYYLENQSRFLEFKEKIIHVVVDDMPTSKVLANSGGDAAMEPAIWNMEYFQRNAIRRGLWEARPDDIIIVSDCDEILRRKTMQLLRDSDGLFVIDLSMYQFFLNMRERSSGWDKVFAYSSKLSPLIPDFNVCRRDPTAYFTSTNEKFTRLADGGWHFTFLGGEEQVKNKLAAYSHTDGWQRKMWDEALLHKQMLELRDVGGGKTLTYCAIDGSFPEVVQSDAMKYLDLGLIKSAEQRIAELELLWNRSVQLEAQLVQKTEQSREQEIENAKLGKILRTISTLIPKSLVNLVPSSRTFRYNWSGGVQSHTAAAVQHYPDVPAFEVGNYIVVHRRDASARTMDNNCGYYSIQFLAADHPYAASCYVWIPEDFAGTRIALSVGEWTAQTQYAADLKVRSKWQRIIAIGSAPPATQSCNMVLRIDSTSDCAVLSTCWQLEEGKVATDYRETAIND